MKLVITIDDDIYDDYLKQGATLPKYGTEIDSLYKALWNGVPLPKHHGNLVDRDAIEVLRIGNIKREYDKGFDAGVTCMVNRILDAPTIIEGSDSE